MLFLIKIEDPYGDNIEMILTAKNKENAVELFKKKLGSKSKKGFGTVYCMSLVKEYKSEYKKMTKSTYDNDETRNYYLNKKNYCIGDYSYCLSEAVAVDFYENALKAYTDYYYREGYSLKYHLDHNIFEVIDLTKLDSGNKILNITSVYRGR